MGGDPRSPMTSEGARLSSSRCLRSPRASPCSAQELQPQRRLCRGGEEVDEQLVDAFSLVVMHPVRRVGWALHAVEVGYVVTVGLGECGAEVGIAVPPNDQC